MKIKITCGFRKDQAFSIDESEAHKAYYLFFNPDARSVFGDGLGIKGSDIDRIEPDYQGTMGWNPTHNLDTDDWNEIRDSGADRQLRLLMSTAQAVAKICNENDLQLSLVEVIQKYPQIAPKENLRLAAPRV